MPASIACISLPIGKPVEAGNLLRRSFWPQLDKAGLPHIRFHDLHHTAATLLLQQGVHPKVVSELLGHSSIGLTLDIYSHVIPDMQQQAVVAMDALLSPTATFIFDMSGATQYASPPYPIIPKETVYVTSLSDRRRKLCHSHV